MSNIKETQNGLIEKSTGRKIKIPLDVIILQKDLTVKVDGIPFKLKSDTLVAGNANNLKLLSRNYKSFGLPSVFKLVQSEVSERIKPTSGSMNSLK